jgi:hypothetical protein
MGREAIFGINTHRMRGSGAKWKPMIVLLGLEAESDGLYQ